MMLAAWVASFSEDFDCRKCTKRFCDEDRQTMAEGPDGSPVRSRGAAPFPQLGWQDPEGKWSSVCLLPQVPAWWPSWLSLFSKYRQGMLPYPGGYLAQPAPVLEGLDLISSIVAKADQKRIEASRG